MSGGKCIDICNPLYLPGMVWKQSGPSSVGQPEVHSNLQMPKNVFGQKRVCPFRPPLRTSPILNVKIDRAVSLCLRVDRGTVRLSAGQHTSVQYRHSTVRRGRFSTVTALPNDAVQYTSVQLYGAVQQTFSTVH